MSVSFDLGLNSLTHHRLTLHAIVAGPGPSPLDSDNEDVAADNFGIGGQLNKNLLNNNNNNSYGR